MKAIIVPGVTDMNKGDQALVWESHRLLKDTELFNDIYILDSGDTAEERENLCGQSENHGFKFIRNILTHPRRGQHKQNEHIKESKFQLAKQVFNASLDFISTKFLLVTCKNLPLVKLLFSRKVYTTVKEFSEADAIFVKGGGFIHAYGERTAPYLMWYFLFYPRLAKRLNKKVIFLPNSFGPFKGLTVKSQVRSVLRDFDLIYAREKVSSESLGHLLKRNIPVEMDLGFFLQRAEQYQALEILSKYKLSPDDKIIGVTVRPYRFPSFANPELLYKKYIIAVSDLIMDVTARGFKVALCNQSLGPNAHEDDRNAIKDILRLVHTDDNIVWINENLNCKQLKTLYANFHLFIGTRFHSVIFSLTSLVPSIAIGYGGNKAKGIMGDFNLNDLVIQIQDVDSDILMRMFNNAILEYDNIKDQLHRSLTSVGDSRERLIKDIQALYKC